MASSNDDSLPSEYPDEYPEVEEHKDIFERESGGNNVIESTKPKEYPPDAEYSDDADGGDDRGGDDGGGSVDYHRDIFNEQLYRSQLDDLKSYPEKISAEEDTTAETKEDIEDTKDNVSTDRYKNLYSNRLPPMKIFDYEKVDSVIMFYLVCAYEGVYRGLYISKNIDAEIPISIKKQFDIHLDSYGSYTYIPLHGRIYSKYFMNIDDSFIRRTMIGDASEHEEFINTKYKESTSYCVIKYRQEKIIKFRHVLFDKSASNINTIKSLVSRYNIFNVVSYFPRAERTPGSIERYRCLMADTRIISLAYQILCYSMGINMDLPDDFELTIQNIFDFETKKKASKINRAGINKHVVGIESDMENILQRYPHSKVINILPNFAENSSSGYNKNPFDIPGDMSIIYYRKYNKKANEYHACFLISDKKTNNVLMYDPWGFKRPMNADIDELRTIFGKDIDVTETARNLVLGLQHYDEEGYCVYFSLIFIMIFMLVYSWTRIDPVILLSCIEGVIHDEFRGNKDTLETFVKYFVHQMNIKVNQINHRLYTPSNCNYEPNNLELKYNYVLDKRWEGNNFTYVLSWMIIMLDNIIKMDNIKEEKQYIKDILRESDPFIKDTIFPEILQNIVNFNAVAISNKIDMFSKDKTMKGQYSVYYYCLILQLYKIHYKLSGRLSDISEDSVYLLDSGNKLRKWLLETDSDPIYSQYVMPLSDI